MRTSHCLACKSEFETPVIRESAFWRAVINRNQNLLGKTMLVVRRHEEQVAALTTDQWSELLAEMRWVTDRVRHAFAPDHFNYSFLMNMDRHVHLHVLPRYVGSRHLAGVEFTDLDYPSAYQAPPTPGEVAPATVVAAVYGALTGKLGEPPAEAG